MWSTVFDLIFSIKGFLGSVDCKVAFWKGCFFFSVDSQSENKGLIGAGRDSVKLLE